MFFTKEELDNKTKSRWENASLAYRGDDYARSTLLNYVDDIQRTVRGNHISTEYNDFRAIIEGELKLNIINASSRGICYFTSMDFSDDLKFYRLLQDRLARVETMEECIAIWITLSFKTRFGFGRSPSSTNMMIRVTTTTPTNDWVSLRINWENIVDDLIQRRVFDLDDLEPIFHRIYATLATHNESGLYSNVRCT